MTNLNERLDRQLNKLNEEAEGYSLTKKDFTFRLDVGDDMDARSARPVLKALVEAKDMPPVTLNKVKRIIKSKESEVAKLRKEEWHYQIMRDLKEQLKDGNFDNKEEAQEYLEHAIENFLDSEGTYSDWDVNYDVAHALNTVLLDKDPNLDEDFLDEALELIQREQINIDYKYAKSWDKENIKEGYSIIDRYFK